MKKIGFILDSFACESKEFMDKHNIGFLPLKSEIDGVVYEDGVNINQKELLEKIKNSKSSCKSSMPNPGLMEEVFQEMSAKYDDVLYLPISSALSSTFSIANNLAKEYSNVHVFDNTWGSQQLITVVEFAKKFYEEHDGDMKALFEELKKIEQKSLLFVLPQDVIHIVEGGRVSSFKKFVLKTIRLLKLKPYVRFANREAHTGGLAKSLKRALEHIYSKLIGHLWIGDPEAQSDEYLFDVTWGIDEEFNKLIDSIATDKKIKINSHKLLCSAVAAHTGYDATAISIMPNLKKWK